MNELVLSDLLCFVKNKYTTMPMKQLRSVLMDFYSEEIVSEAKVRLLSDINALSLTQKLPHMPQRRHGAGRLASEIDDIFTMLIMLDESKMLDQLPKYVSASPDNMPMPNLRLYEGDMQALFTLLKSMDGRIEEFGSALAAITRNVKALQEWPTLLEFSRQPARPAPVTCEINTTKFVQGGQQIIDTRNPTTVVPFSPAEQQPLPAERLTRDWATAAMSTPYSSANRFDVLGSATDDDERQLHQFTRVSSKRNKRERQRSARLEACFSWPTRT